MTDERRHDRLYERDGTASGEAPWNDALAMTDQPNINDVVEKAFHELIEAARMYEASCRLGGKDQEFASRKLDAAKSALLNAARSERPAVDVRGLVEAGNALSFAAQTSGGTAGRDETLVEAIDKWAAALEHLTSIRGDAKDA